MNPEVHIGFIVDNDARTVCLRTVPAEQVRGVHRTSIDRVTCLDCLSRLREMGRLAAERLASLQGDT